MADEDDAKTTLSMETCALDQLSSPSADTQGAWNSREAEVQGQGVENEGNREFQANVGIFHGMVEEEVTTNLSLSTPVAMDQESAVKLGKRRSWNDSIPNQDGGGGVKRVKKGRVNGALLCLPLRKPSKMKNLTPLVAAKELARCMHESKYHLLRNTIVQVGVEKTIQLFNETSQIQEAGGVVSCEGKIKAPGGVFFSLLKKTATKEQLTEIFRVEKQNQKNCKKKNSMRRRLGCHSSSGGSIGGGGGGGSSMEGEVVEKPRTGVFSRLGVTQTPDQREEQWCSEADDIVGDCSTITTAAAEGQTQGQSPEVEGDKLGDLRTNMFSRLGNRKEILNGGDGGGQSAEVEGDKQTTRTNVFSRLGIRKEMQGSEVNKDPPATGVGVQGAWQNTGSSEDQDQTEVSVQGVWQTGTEEEEAWQEEGECMEVDSEVVRSGGVCGDPAPLMLRGIEDIWEQEKAAALEFDNASDSGVDFAVHLSIH